MGTSHGAASVREDKSSSGVFLLAFGAGESFSAPERRYFRPSHAARTSFRRLGNPNASCLTALAMTRSWSAFEAAVCKGEKCLPYATGLIRP
jgi:hypothetical protein